MSRELSREFLKHRKYLLTHQDEAIHALFVRYTGVALDLVVLFKFIRTPTISNLAQVKKHYREEAIHDIILGFNRFITDAPTPTIPVTVYRGVIEPFHTKNSPIFSFKGPVSTSFNKNVSLKFAGSRCCLYELHIPAGVHWLYVASISQVTEEEEALIPSTYFFRIVGERVDEGKQVYVCEFSHIEDYKPPTVTYDIDEKAQGELNGEVNQTIRISIRLNDPINVIVQELHKNLIKRCRILDLPPHLAFDYILRELLKNTFDKKTTEILIQCPFLTTKVQKIQSVVRGYLSRKRSAQTRRSVSKTNDKSMTKSQTKSSSRSKSRSRSRSRSLNKKNSTPSAN
jgi:hypothetical protein